MSPKGEKNLSSPTSGSKKIRMTLACERCRSKKVKCDAVHPTCTRCRQTDASCSYTGSSTQVDLFNLVKINETVDLLQQRVLSLESELKQAHSVSPPPPPEAVIATRTMDEDILMTTTGGTLTHTTEKNNEVLQGLLAAANSRWSLSLTPKGLRIDTNIVSLHDLYDLLLSGMSQLEIGDTHSAEPSDSESRSSSSSSTGSTLDSSSATTAPSVQRTALLKKKPLWKSGLKVFPLYSSWESNNTVKHEYHQQQNQCPITSTIPKATMDKMMDIYTECFLCLPSPELEGSVVDRYHKGELDEMLLNIILAWTARHGAIYHDLFAGQDPNLVGEAFFNRSKMLLKERFMVTNVDTMHSLLMMYIYTLGDPSSHAESEAYMYLGLANRMCLDLKMHCKIPDNNSPVAQERHRRFYGVLNFLETLCTVHSDKPFSLPPHDTVSVGLPTVMAHETGETRWRVEFMIQRFRITHIYRNIICKTAQEKPLLSTVSALDKELKEWYQQLPGYFMYKSGDIHKRDWKSKSFREQACIKLNFEYNFQMCQLYGLFFSRARDSQSDESPTAVDVLSKELCVRGAEMIIELLGCWVQLEQLWCHFSLETFMIVLMVYGTLLIQATPGEMESAKTNLAWMARMLAHSPVSHHKHVIGLVDRIRAMFVEFFDERLDLKVDQRTGIKREYMDQTSTPTSPPLPSSSLSEPATTRHPRQKLYTSHSYRSPIATAPSSRSENNMTFVNPSYSSSVPLHQQTTALMTPVYSSSTNSVIDVTTGTSPFDLHKTQSMCNSSTSDLPFSDFLYTPTLTDLHPTSTSGQQHTQASPMMDQRMATYYRGLESTSTPTPTSSSHLVSNNNNNMGYSSYQNLQHQQYQQAKWSVVGHDTPSPPLPPPCSASPSYPPSNQCHSSATPPPVPHSSSSSSSSTSSNLHLYSNVTSQPYATQSTFGSSVPSSFVYNNEQEQKQEGHGFVYY